MAHHDSKPRLPRTVLAEKYGTSGWADLRDILPMKSGLTPVHTKPQDTWEAKLIAEDVRWLQRLTNQNFTAAELEYLDTLAPLYKGYEDEVNVEDTGSIAIYPALQRHKWNSRTPDHIADMPMGGDFDGYWNPRTNDLVWEMMLPAIRIASLYISHMHMWPWFDALFAAEWTDIPLEEVPFSIEYQRQGWKRFVIRDPRVHTTEHARKAVQDKLRDFAEKIYFNLDSEYVDTTTGLKIMGFDEGTVAGSTTSTQACEETCINISFEPLEALLPGNKEQLNEAEKALLYVDLAITLVHEMAHALYQRQWIVSLPGYGRLRELYHQDEVRSEMGASMEQAMFGGQTVAIRMGHGKGSIGTLQAANCTYDIYNAFSSTGSNFGHPTLANLPPNYDRCTFWPAPVDWYLEMGKKSRFNEHIMKYGINTAKYTKIVGSEYRLNEDSTFMTLRQKDHWVEFEGLPSKRQRTGLRTQTSNVQTQEPHYIRRQVQRIKRRTVPARKPVVNKRTATEVDDEDGDEDEDNLPPCPRFHEISTFLINNRRQLALHTMCFIMPEGLLRKYILRLGGLTITAREWRVYLQHCNARPYLFKFHAEEKPNSISTYRGSIQLHASSWPKTDLSPLKSLRSGLEVERVDAIRLLVAMQSMISSPTNAGPITDKLFHCPAFWDYGKEIFLDQLNKLIVAEHPQLMAAGMKVMSRRELDDIVEWMVHRGRFLTWAPEGIIRRLPWTYPEFDTLIKELSPTEDIKVQKGRHVFDWDADLKTLRRLDRKDINAEALEQFTGIAFVDGRKYSEAEYYEMRKPPPPPLTQEEMEEAEREREREARATELADRHIREIDAYKAANPDATGQEAFENAWWPTWKENKEKEEGGEKEEGEEGEEKEERVDGSGDGGGDGGEGGVKGIEGDEEKEKKWREEAWFDFVEAIGDEFGEGDQEEGEADLGGLMDALGQMMGQSAGRGGGCDPS